MKQPRNMSIELLRIALMFGIVWLHVITQAGFLDEGGVVARRFSNVLSPCVEGFCFISGYYGIRFRIGRAVSIVGMLALYTVIMSSWISGRTVLYGFTHSWFVYAYVVLMLMSPALNAALEKRSAREILRNGLPIVFAVYGWSYLCVIPVIKQFVPGNYGFAPLSFFTLIGIYTAARMFRLLDVERWIPVKTVVVGLVAGLVGVIAGFYHHSSPLSFLYISCLFTLVKKVRLPSLMEHVVACIAPSVFSIFLIHGTSGGHRFYSWLCGWMIVDCAAPPMVSYLVVALIVFVLCLLMDLLRRVIIEGLRHTPVVSVVQLCLGWLAQRREALMNWTVEWISQRGVR